MDRRERLRRCFFHEELDRPAVNVRTGFPADDPTYDTLKAYLQAHTELKRGWSVGTLSGYPSRSFVEPVSEDFDRAVTVLPTPKGELRASYRRSRKGHPGMPETYFVKSAADAEAYLSLPPPTLLAPDVSGFFAVDREVGDRGIVEVGLGSNPGGWTAELCGSETFAILSIERRDLLHALCERRQQAMLLGLKYLLSKGVGPYFAFLGQEYVAPPLHGRRDFCDFNMRYDQAIVDTIHEAGGRVHIHCHGGIKSVFQDFVKLGVDVLHPCEPPPLGDLPAATAKAMAGSRLTIEGNIQIHRLYEGTPADVRAEIEALIRDAFGDRRGLIVCPSASPYMRGEGERSWPQFKAMIDTVLAYRG